MIEMRAEETSLSMKSKMNEVNDDESSELKSLVSKLEKELTEVKGEVTSLKKDIKQVKESEAFLHFQKKKKSISFFQLMSVQSEKSDIILFIIAIIGSMAAGLSMPLISLLLGDVIDGFDGSIPKEKVPKVIHSAIINFICAGLGIFFGSLLMVTFWTIIGKRLSDKIKIDYFNTIMKQDQSYFDETNTFEFTTKIQSQTKIIENGIGTKVGVALSAFSQFIASFIIGYITSWKLSLVISAMLPLLGLGGFFMANAMKQGTAEMRTYEKAGGMAEEVLYQIKTVASFANFDDEKTRYNNFLDISRKAGINQGYKTGFGIGFIIFVIYGSYALAVGYGSRLIYNNGEKTEDEDKDFGAGGVITVIFAIIFGCFSLGQAAPNIKAIYEACNASQDYFDLKNRKIKHSFGKEKPDKNEAVGHLEFKDVSFKYNTGDKMVLNKINIDFEQDKKMAIVGPSGIGKSTILSLIERFYEPTSGMILFDGKNIKNFEINHWRSFIGYVQQEPVLFNSSIRENIIFGRENITESQINEACEKAYATEIINKVGLDYIVGVKGEKLSGGQRQRIAIARAVLLKPKILLLDEATSALDNKSELEVQKALDMVSKGISTIVIAHKIDTIKNSDKIFCFGKDGNIAEEGTHDELMEKKGIYSELYMKRAKAEEDRRASLLIDENDDSDSGVNKISQSINNNNPIINNNDIGNNYMSSNIPLDNINNNHYLNTENDINSDNSLKNKKILSQRNEMYNNNIEDEFKSLNIHNSKHTFDKVINMNEVRLKFPSDPNFKNINEAQLNNKNNIKHKATFNSPKRNSKQNISNTKNEIDLKISINNENFSSNRESINNLNNKDNNYIPQEDKLKAEEIENKILFKKARKHAFSLLKNHKGFMIGCTVAAGCNGLVWPIYGILLANAIGALSQKDINDVKKDGMINALEFLALATFAGGSLWMQNYFFYGLGEILTSKYRKEVFDKYLNLHMAFFDMKENSPGSLLTKLTTDTTKISGVATTILGQLLQTSVTLIVGIVVSFVCQWALTLINIAFMPLVIGSYYLQFTLQQGVSDGNKFIDEESGNILSESVLNSKTIFSYNMQYKIVDIYAKIIYDVKNEKKENKKCKYSKIVINGFFYSITQFVIFAMYATLFYVGGNLYKKDKASFTNILRAIFTILFSALGVGIAQMFVGDYSAAKQSIINLQKIIDTKSEIDVLQSQKDGIKKNDLKGKIEFKNVKFKYANSKYYVFKKLNFTINPGENIAFVGPSGSGKTTIISLIERFYDVISGEILIDDINIKDYDLVNLRKNIGIVLQQPVLFNRTIKENIRYGKLDCHDIDIENAAKEANIYYKLMEDDNDEINVSGGEKQRIAISRAILKNPVILLLDEATSALDKENEEIIKESLNKLMKNRTSIVIAHRLSTIINCDRILFLYNGEILESGTHDELMRLNGRYAALYKGASS